jgi:ABC-2 type transport system ATP-binding protein
VVTLKAEDNKAAMAELRENYNLSPIIENGAIIFSIPEGEKFLPRLMRSLKSPLLSIGVRRPTLDDVFLKLTGRAIRDEEANSKEQMKSMMMIHRRRR